MDALFLGGAAVIGIMRRYWTAVGAALFQLTGLALAIIGKVTGNGVALLVGVGIYFVGIAVAWLFYVAGQKLAKEHPRREVCELLGGAAFLGTAGLAVSVLLKVL